MVRGGADHVIASRMRDAALLKLAPFAGAQSWLNEATLIRQTLASLKAARAMGACDTDMSIAASERSQSCHGPGRRKSG